MIWYLYNCKMITTVSLVNIHHHMTVICVLVIWTWKASRGNSQICRRAWLATVIIRILRSQDLLILQLEVCTFWPPSPLLLSLHLLPLVTTSLFSVCEFRFCLFSDSTYRWDHMVFSFSAWLVLHRIMASKSIQMARFPPFLWLNDIPWCPCILHFLYPRIHWWALRCPRLGHCDWCCSEHGGADIFSSECLHFILLSDWEHRCHPPEKPIQTGGTRGKEARTWL